MRILWTVPCKRFCATLAMLLCASLLLCGTTAAQKDKKKKKEASTSETKAPSPLPDEQQIEFDISEMLGGWQTGDVERMHKHYADDVSVVSGAWEPPVYGWANYLTSYQRLRARMEGVRKDRQNTLVRVNGNFAWACFQWDFEARVDGQQMMARGQSTLVFEKRSGAWLIVHDHTSLVQMQSGPAAAPASATPPPAGAKPPSR